jgi:hypothetical protein
MSQDQDSDQDSDQYPTLELDTNRLKFYKNFSELPECSHCEWQFCLKNEKIFDYFDVKE